MTEEPTANKTENPQGWRGSPADPALTIALLGGGPATDAGETDDTDRSDRARRRFPDE